MMKFAVSLLLLAVVSASERSEERSSVPGLAKIPLQRSDGHVDLHQYQHDIRNRVRRQMSFPGMKMPRREVVIPNWNPHAKTQPWQRIKINKRSAETLSSQDTLFRSPRSVEEFTSQEMKYRSPRSAELASQESVLRSARSVEELLSQEDEHRSPRSVEALSSQERVLRNARSVEELLSQESIHRSARSFEVASQQVV